LLRNNKKGSRKREETNPYKTGGRKKGVENDIKNVNGLGEKRKKLAFRMQ